MKNITEKDFDKKLKYGPYEKVYEKGPGALSDAQLLAVILRTGTYGEDATSLSEKILETCCEGRGLKGLCRASIPELMSIKGIGRVKAAQLQCILELSSRLSKYSPSSQPILNTPETIALYFMKDMALLDKEHVIVVMLDIKCRLIKYSVIVKGGIGQAMLSVRDVLTEVIKYRAFSFVIIHNHPSGDPTPSRDDILMTEKIQRGAQLIGIPLIDHIIIGDNIYTSLKELNLLKTI